jgi:hypothetical protein
MNESEPKNDFEISFVLNHTGILLREYL